MQTRSGTDRLIDGAPSTPCLHHREKGLGLGRPLVVCEEGSKGRGKRDSRRWEDWAAVKGCFYSTGRLGTREIGEGIGLDFEKVPHRPPNNAHTRMRMLL